MMSGDMDFEKMIDDYVRQAQIGMLTGVKGRLEDNIQKLKNPPANPYSVLGLKSTCTEEEFRTAYRAKAKASHPDMGGSAEEFKKVQAAYEAIKRLKGWS
jgi:DnaJ-class molecular chaperone